MCFFPLLAAVMQRRTKERERERERERESLRLLGRQTRELDKRAKETSERRNRFDYGKNRWWNGKKKLSLSLDLPPPLLFPLINSLFLLFYSVLFVINALLQ